MHKRRTLALAFALAAVSAVAGTVRAQAAGANTAFTLSNAAAGNRVIVFERASGGGLHRVGSVATGGHGTGGHLYAVNAGSNTLSVLGVSGDHVWREQVIGSGGSQPISVTASWNRVYVLNAGDGSVTGFRVTSHGLARIAQGHRPLAASGSGPAQVALTPSGSALVVTNKTTNTIDTLRVRGNGSLAHAVAHASVGATPFGFAFTSRGVLVVSDAGEAPSSAATAYRVGPFGGLRLRSGPLQTNQLAACWVATSPNGRFAFVSDAHSGTISAIRVSAHGQLSLIDPSGISGSGGSGSTTLDSSVTGDGRYLSVLVFNTKPGVNSIVTFRIGSGGTLTWLNAAGSVPGSATGLVTG